MRDLKSKVGRWLSLPLPSDRPMDTESSAELPEGVLAYASCRSDDFLYYRLGVEIGGETFWYLYAMSVSGEPSLWVLGVFDTPGQADFFLALHSNNPLWVPALRLMDAGADWLRIDSEGHLLYPHYAGVYQVGLKSYRVLETSEPGIYTATYSDRDHVEYLGQANEKEVCLLVYSHFDARLRGCKLC